MTVFPENFDSDVEIPRVDKNVSEISGDAINSLRDAVFAIQRALGLNIQGNKPSLADRISVSIDSDGFIKKSALENIGLLTLPVTDKEIGNNAGIKESKLDLDFGTAFLNSKVSSLKTDVDGISAGLSSQTASFNLHILGQANFHDGYQIKINSGTSFGVAGLQATTVGDAINEIGTLLLSGNNNITPHINLGLPSTTKHLASEIGVNTESFDNIDKTATDLQSALNSVDDAQGALGVVHIDNFHANGILKNINSGTDFNARRKVLGPETGATYTEGTSVVTITSVSSFTSIEPGDILEIQSPSNLKDLGTFQIRAVGPLSDTESLGGLPSLSANQLAIFHTFKESRAANDNVVVNVYKPASISSELAPLACAVRSNETIVDTISVLPPDAARVVSLGFNGSILNLDGYEIAIRAGIGDGQTRELTITDLNRERLQTNQAQPVDAKSVAERINAFVSDPDLGYHFPISAYKIGNELAIAHNLVGPDFTIEILDGYNGNFPLGLDAYGANLAGVEQVGNDNNLYSVNGVSRSSIREVFDGYGKVDSDTSTFMLYEDSGKLINPLRFGIKSGSVIHVTDHPTNSTNGSYTLFSSNSTSVSLFSAEQIDAPSAGTTFDVLVTDSHIPLSELDNLETSQGLVQVLVDEDGRVKTHQRLIYGTSLGSGVEITNLSPNFPVGDVNILTAFEGSFINFNIIDDTIAGNTVKIHEDFQGQFKLFHSNNLDYLVIKITAGSIPGGLEAVTINEPLNFDESMEICSVHFNGSLSITNISDTRQFGNLSINEIRDDFVEVFSQRPVSDLRSNGVSRGFDILDIPFFDSVTNTEALPVQGGVAYVDGVRVAVETQKVTVSSHDSEGTIFNDVRRIVAINNLGSLTVVSDELGELLADGYDSSVAFGKLLPLYEITLVDGGIDQVTDLRLFINDIDDKIELIVDETNNVVGNFRSLEGALLYAQKYPSKEKLTIRIVNTVTPDRALTVPRGVSIVGDILYGGEEKHRILNNVGLLGGDSFITLEGNNRLENIAVESSLISLQAPLVSIQGDNINIEKCSFKYGEAITSNNTLVAITVENTVQDKVRIVNNLINNVYTGISSVWGCENLVIEDNIVTNLSGTGGISQGIFVSTLTRPVDKTTIKGNTVRVPSIVLPSDIRGIAVDVRESIEVLRIDSNSVIHLVENTMTNGIRVTSEASGGTGNKVNQLFLSDNYITGIRLDDNEVFGIYLDDIDNASVHNNSVFNIGVSGVNRSDTAMVFLGSRLNFAEVDNNVFKNSDVQRGLVFNNGSGRLNATSNTFYNLGTDAQYIRGTAPWSDISNNVLTGPGETGIRWSGAKTKISNNLLNAISGTDYAFEEYGMFIQTSDVDILNNTITDMIFDSGVGSVIISNVNSASDRIKIVGNTFSGDKIAKFVDLFGSNHMVSNNKLFNTSVNAVASSFGFFLNQVSDALFNGNSFDGEITSAFDSGGTSVSNLTITNNSVTVTTLETASIILDNDSVNDCFIIGNRFPDGSSGVNIIGPTPSISQTNDNLIGVNWGLQDSVSLSAFSGVSGFESIDDAYAGISHWVMKDTNDYWEINRANTSESRRLYFPITSLPNGTKLTSINVQGRTVTGDTAMVAQLFKRSVNSGLTLAAISNPITLPTVSSGSNFTNEDAGSEVPVLTAGGEIVNFLESGYFLQITHTQASPTEPDQIRVYGITVNFTY